MISWSLVFCEASNNNESFDERHSDVSGIPWFPGLQNELDHFWRIAARLSVLSSLCRGPSRLLHCGNRTYSIRGIIDEKDGYYSCGDTKKLKTWCSQTKWSGTTLDGCLYDRNKKVPRQLADKQHELKFKRGTVTFSVFKQLSPSKLYFQALKRLDHNS